MKNVDCGACADLREDAPNFLRNGVTTEVCNSLKNNTGFSTSTTSDDCEDLDKANDCLIGMMEPALDSYDICDWKEFMKDFIPNLHQMIKAEICAMCGQWDMLEKNQCELDYLFNGASFEIGETTSGNAYAVAGKGVSFLTARGGVEHNVDLSLEYIAGGLMRGTGTFMFYNSSFTDTKECMNFDNDAQTAATRNPITSSARVGNPIWGQTGRPANGGELICEFRIKKSAYPQIKRLWGGIGHESGGGVYNVTTEIFNGDSTSDTEPVKYAYGQHGWCDKNGDPDGTGYSYGHAVPAGWWYVQLRMSYINTLTPDGRAYTPRYHMATRMNQDEIDC